MKYTKNFIKSNISIYSLLVFLILIFVNFSCLGTSLSTQFYAYHTNLKGSEKPHEKYRDLIVKFDLGQIEFRHDKSYLPVWQTDQGTYQIHNFSPEIEAHTNAYYSYVRIIAETPEKIVVHYKHHINLEGIEASIDQNPLYPGGLTSVVHEIFTIYPDYTITREVKNATGTRYQDWINPDYKITQKITLHKNGIAQNVVSTGLKAPIYPRPAYQGNKINKDDDENNVILYTFDDGMYPHQDNVVESVTGTKCKIEGLSTFYTKGVSGTALAFDGYYTSVSLPADKVTAITEPFTISAWIAPDAYPYNKAPIIHQSNDFGNEGFYLGLDAYGFPFLTINGETTISKEKIDFGKWSFIAATIDKNQIALYVNGINVGKSDLTNTLELLNGPLQIGMNNEKDRGVDFVRENAQNISYYIGFHGLIDEVKIKKQALSAKEIENYFIERKPEDLRSELNLSILPGKNQNNGFGAYYTDLNLNPIWDNLWRNIERTDISVEFEEVKGSVKFWKGTNYASNWITENNIWMADQSTETWGPHGCSEHMADKQVRQSFARIIENSPARVIIHWRYPCVDVGYICNNPETNWSDEYYYIYPDGTAIRKVNFNGRGLLIEDEDVEDVEDEEEVDLDATISQFEIATQNWVNEMEVKRENFYNPDNNTWSEELVGDPGPGFQDIQLLTSPGQKALDIVDLNALNVANLNGEVQKLHWKKPNITPFVEINDACIELVNTKSEFKTFAIFQGGYITPWGQAENSKYTDDPFAGPWNHWPVHLIPSDGRYAVDNDRISHFALAANDYVPQQGAMVLHGLTNKPIKSLIPLAKSWKTPPTVEILSGAEKIIYSKEQKAFLVEAFNDDVEFIIEASKNKPIVNPAFILSGRDTNASVLVNGNKIDKNMVKQGFERDANGNLRLVIWLNFVSEEKTSISIN